MKKRRKKLKGMKISVLSKITFHAEETDKKDVVTMTITLLMEKLQNKYLLQRKNWKSKNIHSLKNPKNFYLQLLKALINMSIILRKINKTH